MPITYRHPIKETPVTDVMYTSSIPVFKQMLGSLDAILAKAGAHVTDKKIEPAALTQARLFPDMFPLSKQVQIACDFARGVSARLAGAEVPKYQDNEQTFDELRGLIARSLDFIGSFSPAQFAGRAARDRHSTGNAKGAPLRRSGVSAELRLAAILLPRHHGVCTAAAQRHRDWQAGLHGSVLRGLCQPCAGQMQMLPGTR